MKNQRPVHQVPWKRRLQLLAAAAYIFLIIELPLCCIFGIWILIFFGGIWLKIVSLTYFAYIFYDNSRKFVGLDGNGWMFFRKNILFRCLRDYFPIELIKTAELPPDRNYVIASYPHGFICTGTSVNMNFELSKWLELYPGIRPKTATLNINFYGPVLREIIRLWGFIPASKESLLYHLRKSNDPKHPDNKDGFTSNAVVIMVGGAEEALNARPGQYVLTLKRRKGFVRLAIQTGSPIVPSFSFCEVDIFDQMDNPPDSLIRCFQAFFKKLTGFPILFFKGGDLIRFPYGFVPRRRHIAQVLGAPIEVKMNDNPDPKYVDEIHQKFIDALTDLFENHKMKYIENAEETKLIIN